MNNQPIEQSNIQTIHVLLSTIKQLSNQTIDQSNNQCFTINNQSIAQSNNQSINQLNIYYLQLYNQAIKQIVLNTNFNSSHPPYIIHSFGLQHSRRVSTVPLPNNGAGVQHKHAARVHHAMRPLHLLKHAQSTCRRVKQSRSVWLRVRLSLNI